VVLRYLNPNKTVPKLNVSKYLPTVHRIFGEYESPMPQGQDELETLAIHCLYCWSCTYLKQNKLMEPNTRPIVAEDNQDEYDQSADHITLCPRFEEPALD
jgi:hypothetical protein